MLDKKLENMITVKESKVFKMFLLEKRRVEILMIFTKWNIHIKCQGICNEILKEHISS